MLQYFHFIGLIQILLKEELIKSPCHTGVGQYPCLKHVPQYEWITAYATMTVWFEFTKEN